MSWNEIIFESVFKIPTKNGLTKPSRIRGEGFKFINMGELFAIDRMFDPKMELVPLSETEKVTHKIEKGDLLFARQSLVASGAGKCSIVKEVDDLTVFDSHIIRVRLNQDFCDSNFFYYYFKSSVNNLKSLVQQGVQAGIRASDLSKLKVHYPPLETQIRIASILSTYDDLIENNLKRIKLLEETAQNIYKEWFVNFRFPNYEHTDFDAESGLPVGWEKKTIDTFAEVITGKTPSTANSNFYGGNIPFVKTPDMHDAPYVLSTSIYLSNDGAESQNNKFLPKNSVMVSCIGTAGVVALASTNCQTNQQINSVRFDEEFKAFYFYGFARGLKTLLEGLGSNGATMVNVNKSKFEKIELIVPDSETLKRHYGLVKVIFDQILILQEQNEKLKEARDILLPRLMNRTIEV
ncbi:MAG: restriction endonuclease subunit S [Flavobacterium sp.]|nr:restriction endonuclease subunit S [Flavobacterium sp.]